MSLSIRLQKKLDEHIPKQKQKAFVEKVVEAELNKMIDAKTNIVELFVDGGSRGNPGPAGGGFVLYPAGGDSVQGSEFYGNKTNNQSEYLALRSALREAYLLYPEANIHCFMDSQLVVEQMNGNYKVKSANVKPIFEEVRHIADQFKSFKITHIERAKNKLADKLANEAMDRG